MARLGVLLLLLFFILPPNLFAHEEEPSIKIFGYFQNSLQYWTTFEDRSEQNSFSVQQLNLFLQKNLTQEWTAFVDFELLNNFSASRRWGAFNLEEAWVKYRYNMKFNLKLGLLVPTFNHLNEIKNRTPVLPYLVRPLVYETSFNEFIAIDNFIPERAFIQTYGFFPLGQTKLDYALYVGNSPNINDSQEKGQTGIDTTTTFLVGGRLGIRHRELKTGFSATYDEDNQFQDIAEEIGKAPMDLDEMPRVRLGGDFSYRFKGFYFESEFITVNFDEGLAELELDLDFYYATLGYSITDRLLVYGSYWDIESHFALLVPGDELVENEDIKVPTFGFSFDLNDSIRLKGNYGRVKEDEHRRFIDRGAVEKEQDNFSIYSAAVSVIF